MAVFNLPPSQYQLHLQYMLAPLIPTHLHQWRKNFHYIKMRHFPFSYVTKALQAFKRRDESLPNAAILTPDELVAEVSKRGVDYNQEYSSNIEAFKRSNELLANF